MNTRFEFINRVLPTDGEEPNFRALRQRRGGILVGVALATPLTRNHTPGVGFRALGLLDDRGHGHGDRLDHAALRPPCTTELGLSELKSTT